MGERNAATEAFAGALRTAGTALAGVPALLEGARVHEAAFGKLFEAAEVRDAYHQRLPETEKDVAEALEVIAHFVTGLEGGHPIGARVAITSAMPVPAPMDVPPPPRAPEDDVVPTAQTPSAQTPTGQTPAADTSNTTPSATPDQHPAIPDQSQGGPRS